MWPHSRGDTSGYDGARLPAIAALWRQRQGDGELEDSLGCGTRPSLKSKETR